MTIKREHGFGMIESLIGLSLVTAAIYASISLMGIQKSSNKKRTTQSMYRYLAIQAASFVTSNAERFPPLSFSSAWDSSRDIVIYVACYDKKGNLIPNDLGTREFVFHQQSLDTLDSNEGSGRCPNPIGGIVSYEVRFWYKNPTTREVVIEILDLVLLRSRNPRAIPKQRFTIYR